MRIGRTEFAFSLRDVEQLPFVQHATLRRIEEVVGGVDFERIFAVRRDALRPDSLDYGIEPQIVVVGYQVFDVALDWRGVISSFITVVLRIHPVAADCGRGEREFLVRACARRAGQRLNASFSSFI